MDRTLGRQALAGLLWAALSAAPAGCVGNRAPRNGVFNENIYLRKDFLVRPGDGAALDDGWILRASITKVSTPNPLGGEFLFTAGLESGGALVRFAVTQDRLQLLNQRDLSNVPSVTRTGEVVNAWPITNVDLKYRVNLDGEVTNFYEENQELDWRERQWVKLNFARNDLSDLAPLGGNVYDMVRKCTEADPNGSTTLVPGSFFADQASGYLQWTTSVTLPLRFDDSSCVFAYGSLGQNALRLGRQDVTVEVMYSLTRPHPLDPGGYKLMVVGEKDPIRHKYGVFETTTLARDDNTSLLAARQLANRFDPARPIVFYFSPSVPAEYKPFFLGPGGIKEQTNQLLSDAGVAARVDFKDHDADLGPGQAPRQYGDVRYNYITWLTDRDAQNSFAGLTNLVTDPRSGEILSASIVLNDFPIEDYYVQRLDAFLVTLGASYGVNSPTGQAWPDAGPCKDGDTMPIVAAVAGTDHNRSTVFQRMQESLGRPPAIHGRLSPADFILPQDDDFFAAYRTLVPYQISADPERNRLVTPGGGAGPDVVQTHWQRLLRETEFQALAARIDRGDDPYPLATGPDGVRAAVAFLDNLRDLTVAHHAYVYGRSFADTGLLDRMDPATAFSFEQIAARDARHCINGQWESKSQWIHNLIATYWQQVMWHEFGHALGLRHNFMGSLDQANFSRYQDATGRSHYALYSSSVMEYNAVPDHVFSHPGWGAYDRGAIAWLYGNTLNDQSPPSASLSGQSSARSPWRDPHGFRADGSEIQFLYCSDEHVRYTPLCRGGDLGTTPSAIVANDIEAYEWQYHWNNFRSYRKVWDESPYANVPANLLTDLRRFQSLWRYDWQAAQLGTTLRRIGVKNPDPRGADGPYFARLVDQFTAEMAATNRMVAAFERALVEQTVDERPFRTSYDRYYGDVVQQGIILDKLFALQGATALWPVDNLDPNHAGDHLALYSRQPDPGFSALAGQTVAAMVGGQYDAYPYFLPLAVAQFARDTHAPSFDGSPEVRDWIGGHVFGRLPDFLDFFRDLAVQAGGPGCPTVAACPYDPRPLSDEHGELVGPDQASWIWAYVKDRNQWVAVRRAQNAASYAVVRGYNDRLRAPGGAGASELVLKFFLDAYALYN